MNAPTPEVGVVLTEAERQVVADGYRGPWDRVVPERLFEAVARIVAARFAQAQAPIDEVDRHGFCFDLGPQIEEAMKARGIEEADWSDGRSIADTIYNLGYRLVTDRRPEQP